MKKEFECYLSTDQEDGNAYLEQNGIDYGAGFLIEEELKEMYPDYLDEEGEFFAKCPKKKLKITIEEFPDENNLK